MSVFLSVRRHRALILIMLTALSALHTTGPVAAEMSARVKEHYPMSISVATLNSLVAIARHHLVDIKKWPLEDFDILYIEERMDDAVRGHILQFSEKGELLDVTDTMRIPKDKRTEREEAHIQQWETILKTSYILQVNLNKALPYSDTGNSIIMICNDGISFSLVIDRKTLQVVKMSQ